jgi:hypothetical protein
MTIHSYQFQLTITKQIIDDEIPINWRLLHDLHPNSM